MYVLVLLHTVLKYRIHYKVAACSGDSTLENSISSKIEL